MADANDSCSLRRAKRLMTVTHMFASVGVKSARFARPVGEMRRVPRSYEDFGKSLRMLASWLGWCGSASWRGERCLPSTGMCSCSVPRSRR